MPGRHINDQQVRTYMRLHTDHTQATAAIKAGLSVATARRIDLEDDPVPVRIREEMIDDLDDVLRLVIHAGLVRKAVEAQLGCIVQESANSDDRRRLDGDGRVLRLRVAIANTRLKSRFEALMNCRSFHLWD